MGSAMDHLGEGSNKPMALEMKLTQAKEFLADYYKDSEHHEQPLKGEEERWEMVKQELEAHGFYKLTRDELVWGARTAWRNAPRCPARVMWKKLIVFDCRQLTDTDLMFMAICRHLEVSLQLRLNGGNIFYSFFLGEPQWWEHPAGDHNLPGEETWRERFAGLEQTDHWVRRVRAGGGREHRGRPVKR